MNIKFQNEIENLGNQVTLAFQTTWSILLLSELFRVEFSLLGADFLHDVDHETAKYFKPKRARKIK